MVNSFFYPEWREGWREEPNELSAGGAVPLEGEPGEYLPDRLSKEATKFIEDHKDTPFFLYLSHYTVHTPMEGKEELVRKYREKVIPGHGQNNPIYGAMIESMDESVGRILDKLDELGLSEKTVVVFLPSAYNQFPDHR